MAMAMGGPSSAELTDAQRAAVELLRASQRVILTGHQRPDGDAQPGQRAHAVTSPIRPTP